MADLSITPQDVNRLSGGEDSGTAGETITGGQCVFIDTADANKIKRATNTSAAGSVVAGISLIWDVRTGQPLRYQTDGEIDIGATTIEGETYVLGASGAIHPASDLLATEYMTTIGVGKAPTSLLLSRKSSGVQLASAGTTGEITVTTTGVLVVSGTSAAGITGAGGYDAGSPLYEDATESSRLREASNAASASAQVVGIGLDRLANQLQPAIYLPSGEINIGGTVTVGELYVLSTLGKIKPVGDVAATEFVTWIGIGKTTTNLDLGIFPSGRQRA